MKICFSWDDGALEDVKLFELHNKYEIPAMFFVPTVNQEGREVISSKVIRDNENEYIHFGSHTANHTYLTALPIAHVEKEILDNKIYLEDILGHEVNDFCLPGGKYNNNILKIAYKHFKTVRTADIMEFKYAYGPLKPSFHLYNRGYKSLIYHSLMQHSYRELAYILKHPYKSYFEIISDLIPIVSTDLSKQIMIWGHSWEIEKYELWNEVEKLMLIAKEYNCCKYEEMFDKK